MVDIIIKKKAYHLPLTTQELTLDNGMQLLSASKLLDKESINFKKSIISCLLNCPVENLSHIDNEVIEALYSKIPYLNDAQQFFFVKTFKLKKNYYGLIDFDKLTVFEYSNLIDLLEDESENLDKILSIIYRKITHKKQSYKSILLSKIGKLSYKSKITYVNLITFVTGSQGDNDDLFRQNLSYAEGRGAVLHFIDWKTKLDLEFWQIYENGKDPDEDEYDPFEKLEQEQGDKIRKDLPNIGQMWGLFHLIFEISNGDKRLIDYWYEKPIREFFTHCTYVKQRSIYLDKLNNNVKENRN